MTKREISWKGLHFLIVILLVIGVFFRFVNLGQKPYWIDEATNSFRVSGHTEEEFFEEFSNGRVIGIEDLQKYQYPHGGKGVIDTIKSLAVEEPQSPPLYYTIARFWMQWFGHSVAAMRSLSALISLLAFPCIYWLCLELFEWALTGWVAMALIAVSPVHVLYAQEARLYSLWTVTILLSSAALLRAMRVKTNLSWGIYAASLIVGLYTFPLSGLVAIGHGVYVAFMERFRLSKTLTAYLIASLAALLAYAPWIFFIVTNSHKMAPFRAAEIGILRLILTWVNNLSRVFFDFNINSTNIGFDNLLTYLTILLILLILILLAYSIYFLYQETPKGVWLFVFLLIGTTTLALILPDLILGGRRSGYARYLFPCYLGVQIAVSYLLATKISSFSISNWQRRWWQLVTIALFSCGLISCTIISQAETWWIKWQDSMLQMAPIINQTTQPLLISEWSSRSEGTEICLSYLLKPKIQILLVFEPNIPKIQVPEGFSDVFVLAPSKELRYELEQVQNYKLKLVNENSYYTLWRLGN